MMLDNVKLGLGSCVSAMLLAFPALGAGDDPAKVAPSAPLALAGDLVGHAIRDTNGIELGELEDFLIDPADGRIAFAVLRAGSRFQARTGPKALALPDERVDALRGYLRVDMTERKLRNLETVDEALAALEPARRATLVSLREILDADVSGHQGRDLGDVSDVAVDIPAGKTAFVLVEYGGSWLHGGKTVALERPAIRREDGDMKVLADAGHLEQAQAFNPHRPPRVQQVTGWTRIRNELLSP